MSPKTFFVIGALLGGLGVAAGAFGAHALRAVIVEGRVETYATAVRYHMLHALGLLAVAWALTHWPKSETLIAAAGWMFLIGVVLFSGSLYALSLTGIRWLGAITPLGGATLLVGWASLAIGALRG